MSEGYCDVEIDADCDEPFDAIRESRPTSSSGRLKCCECGQLIAKGDTYARFAGRVSGQWDVYRTCAPCDEAASEFFSSGRVYGGMFWESMEYEWDEGANVQGCINRLTTARAKAHMHKQWMKWKGVA
jgi:hypothetical protein